MKKSMQRIDFYHIILNIDIKNNNININIRNILNLVHIKNAKIN